MILATAGHVDHGKSSLVHAITGQDTDRLPEEKARGLSIDLGFAHFTHGDRQFAFVDVPGHEKFLRNMVTGVAGVDAVMLVVAADEGVMPQTHEHAQIIQMLGITSGIVALTRVDLVNQERRQQITDEVQQWLSSTHLAGLNIVPVSAVTGEGIDDIIKAITSLAIDERRDQQRRRFRYLIDRTFSLPGIGLVATGTVVAGRVAKATTVFTLPNAGQTRIRSLQRHDVAVDGVIAGQRAAINLASTTGNHKPLARGDWLVDVSNTPITARFDVHLTLNPATDRAIKHWHNVQLFVGASHYSARIALQANQTLVPNGKESVQGYAQLVVTQPIHVAFGDRFVLRDGAAGVTLAGGRIIDPFPATQKRARQGRQALLAKLDTDDDASALRSLLHLSPVGCDLEQFRAARQIADDDLLEGVSRITLQVGRRQICIGESRYQSIQSAVVDRVAVWHSEKPQQVGPDSHSLRRDIEATIDPGLWLAIIDRLVSDRVVLRSPAGISLPDHVPQLHPDDESLWDSLRDCISADDVQPPALKDLALALDIERESLSSGVNRIAASGRLIRVAANRFFHPSALVTLAQSAVKLDENRADEAGFTAREYRDVSGIGRNLTIDVLEYFDRIRLTRRLGDKRRVIASIDATLGR